MTEEKEGVKCVSRSWDLSIELCELSCTQSIRVLVSVWPLYSHHCHHCRHIIWWIPTTAIIYCCWWWWWWGWIYSTEWFGPFAGIPFPKHFFAVNILRNDCCSIDFFGALECCIWCTLVLSSSLLYRISQKVNFPCGHITERSGTGKKEMKDCIHTAECECVYVCLDVSAVYVSADLFNKQTLGSSKTVVGSGKNRPNQSPCTAVWVI